MINKNPRTTRTSNISWPDLVFLAEADREPFADAQIITLYSHCLNIAEETNRPLQEIKQAEQVEVFRTHLRIVIDEDIVDDETVIKALDFLIHIDNFAVGTKKEFGPKKSFEYKKLH